MQNLAKVVETSHNLLDKVVQAINSLHIVKDINPYLEKISLDSGRVVLFFIVLLFTFIIKFLVDKKLLPLMDRGIKYEQILLHQ